MNLHLVLFWKILCFLCLLAFNDPGYVVQFPSDFLGQSTFVLFEKLEGLFEGDVVIGIHDKFVFIKQTC